MSKQETQNMNVQDIWNIRDARGLNQDEKSFLFVVAARGVMSAAWEKASADMGMKKDRYYRTRKSLTEKNLLEVGLRSDDTTIYRVNSMVLAAYVPVKADSRIANDFSHSANDHSLFANDQLHISEEKVTTKETKKETMKKMNNSKGASVATAPSLPREIRDEDKGMSLDTWSCLRGSDEVAVQQEGITYFLTSDGVTRSEDKKMKSVKEKSVSLIREMKASRIDKTDRVVEHLEHSIVKDRLTDAQASQARTWFFSEDWEPSKEGFQRAAVAVLRASLIEQVA